MTVSICKKCRINETLGEYCGQCVQSTKYTQKYPILSKILDTRSLHLVNAARSGVKSSVDVVSIRCLSCNRQSTIDFISLLKQLRRNVKKGVPNIYHCHPCSKFGESKISIDTIIPIIDVPMTIARFGGIPKNVKKGKVVAKCEDCSNKFEINLSSVLQQARRHKACDRSSIYKCFHCGIQRQDAVEASVVARSKQLASGFCSNLEMIMMDYLRNHNVEYVYQQKLGIYVWDFFLPKYDTVLDVDGEYWHSLPKNEARGRSKFTYTKKHFSHFKPLRIEEKYFLNPSAINKFLSFNLDPELNSNKIDFSISEIKIAMILPSQKSSHDSFLESYHSAGIGNLGKKIYGAYFNNQLIAVCKFSSVVRKEIPSSVNLKCHQMLELNRFCIHPCFQHENLTSWFMHQCLNLIFKDDINVMGLVGISDENFGHPETMYITSNWMEIGKTDPGYNYVGMNGTTVNRKRVHRIANKLKTCESEYAMKHGLEKILEAPKIKFLFHRR